MKQWAFYFDQSRCVGCYACSVACKDWHNIEAGPVQWRRIISREEGAYPKVSLSYLSLSCNHCEKPACANACPADAITKRKDDGIVVVRGIHAWEKDPVIYSARRPVPTAYLNLEKKKGQRCRCALSASTG